MSANRRSAGKTFPGGVRSAFVLCALALTALALSACSTTSDSGEGLLGPDNIARTEIRDAARNNGTTGFYFVVPIAPNLPSYPGTFDATRSPVVEVCVFGSGACVGAPVARFTMGSGVVLDAPNQLYRADWVTGALPTNTLYRIRVIDGANELGYADAKRVAPGETATGLRAQGIVALGNASRLPIRFRIEQNRAPTVVITSPANGTVVPVRTPVTISATATDAEQGDVSNQLVYRSSRLLDPLGTGPSITVTLPGGRQTISASVTDDRGATSTASIDIVVNGVAVEPTLNVPYTGTASLPITLPDPAPAGGLVFNVETSDAARVGIAPSSTTVTIPAGQQSANAVLLGVAPGSATVTVSNAEFGSASSLVSTTAALDIVESVVNFPQGQTSPITVRLRSGGADVAAPPGGLSVTLTAENPECVSATSPIVIPAGLVSTTATVSYSGGSATPCSTTLTASATDVPSVTTDVVPVNVASAALISITTNARVGAGLRALVSVTLGTPAPAGGVNVTLVSANADVLRVSPADNVTAGAATTTVNVPAGQTSRSFYINGMENQTGTVAVTASAPGYTNGTASAIVTPFAFEIINLPTTSTTLSPNTNFSVRVGLPNAGLTAMQTLQDVRVGSPGLPFTVSNSNEAVAQLVTSAGAAQSRTVTVPAGASQSVLTDIAFDPLGGGVTTVAATSTAVGAIALPGASRVVTVSGAGITISANARVGAGLRSVVSFTLGAPAPAGGVTVTLSSANAAVLRVSPIDNVTAGAASTTIEVPAGQTTRSFYVNGMENQTGTVTLTASAPGYSDGTQSAVVVPFAFEIINLPSTSTTLSPNTNFGVRVGLPNASSTALQTLQDVRVGGPGLLFTVSNSNEAVAQLVTAAGAAQSRTVTVPAASSQSVLADLAFDPLGGGATTVSATTAAVGAIGLPGASRVVTVTGAGITIASNPRVGAGLRLSISFTLGAPAPAGGVTVTLASSNASVLRVSPIDNVTAGAASTTVNVPAGQTTRSFYLNGMENETGTVTVTASAPGYSDGTQSFTVEPFAFELINLPATSTTLSPNTNFGVRVGLPNAGLTALQSLQDVRVGGPGLQFTVTNSNAAVAQLVRAAVPAQSHTVTVPAATSQSVLADLAFDPLGVGATTVSATTAAVGAIALPFASRGVTVSGAGISITANPRVGAGLRSLITFTLGAPAPAGGVNVTLVSSNAAVLRLSPADNVTAGAASTTIAVPAGATTRSFYISGMEDQTGTVTVTASAPGFTDGTASATVVPFAFEIINLPATTTTLSPNTNFSVRVGLPNAGLTTLQVLQEARVGSPGLEFTVSNSNAAVAQLVTAAGAAQTRTVTVPGAASQSVLAALAFDPQGVGTTTVSATSTAVGAIALVAASRTVSVIIPVVTVNTIAPVGSGLRRTGTITLGAPAPAGGLSVTVSSGNPNVLTVSPISNTIVGAASTSVVVPQGSSAVQFYLNGIEGLSGGTSTITVAVPGYATVTSAASVAPLAFDISNLPATATATGANRNFIVRVGVGTGSALQELHDVRVGSAGITFTLTNSNAAVAQLVTTSGSAQAGSVTVAAGTSNSQTSVGAGGIAFDPLEAGTTTVSASTTFAGATPVGAASVTVTVSP